jgi:predicted PurR-regulated permease PerM
MRLYKPFVKSKLLASGANGVYEDLNMTSLETAMRRRSPLTRFSCLFMAGLLVLVVWLHLATLLLAVLFTYLALNCLCFPKRGSRWLAVGIFLVLLSAVAYGLGYFVHQTIGALPEIADKAIPSVLQAGKDNGIELPFTDYDSLKDLALDTVRNQVSYLSGVAKFARGATTQIVSLVAGCVVAISLFLTRRFELGQTSVPANLYAQACREIGQRFETLNRSFVIVMGAQVVISAINTVLTAIFILATQLPYAVVVIGVTFLCGIVPVVGNLVSNTVVVAIGFTQSPRLALAALIFLVVIHKLEYLLNSKIVGWRIRNPLWLTLLGLIVGEKLLGLPGMVLAPVVLHYIKSEASSYKDPAADRDGRKEP